jgi:hypothetical protein
MFLTQEVSMPREKIAAQAVQTKLFTPPIPSVPIWDQMSEAFKGRVIEALAQVLLRAHAGGGEGEEKGALND